MKRSILLILGILIVSAFAATTTFDAVTATTVNKVTITAPASSATLTIADGKTLTASNSLTLAGTDATTMTFPSSSGTVPAFSSVAQGDLVYALTATTFSRLAKDTNSTRYLSNQGTSNAPSWNQVNLANGVTGVLPVANGGNGSATQPSFIAYNSNATFSISTGVNKLVLNAEQDDSASVFDSTTNYRWTPNVAGMYLVGCSVSLTAGSNGEANALFIYKNGTRVRDLDGSGFVSTSLSGIPGSASIIQMNGTTDYIEFFTYITAGTATANGSSGSTLYTCAWGIFLKP